MDTFFSISMAVTIAMFQKAHLRCNSMQKHMKGYSHKYVTSLYNLDNNNIIDVMIGNWHENDDNFTSNAINYKVKCTKKSNKLQESI